jgi:hypothetical protein
MIFLPRAESVGEGDRPPVRAKRGRRINSAVEGAIVCRRFYAPSGASHHLPHVAVAPRGRKIKGS